MVDGVHDIDEFMADLKQLVKAAEAVIDADRGSPEHDEALDGLAVALAAFVDARPPGAGG